MDISTKYGYLESDDEFDKVFAERYQIISDTHWTPVEVIKTAVQWLEENKASRILDIGSGVGKFCVLGSIISKLSFIGVEKRKNLFHQAKKISAFFNTTNAFFINDNITNINFKEYDAFYYFNPFCEQIAHGDWIDKKPDFSEEKYLEYVDYVINELKDMPNGTMVITYYSNDLFLPISYKLKNMLYEGQLLLWIKED